LELLKEVVPGLSRVGVLWNPANPVNPIIFKQTPIAARALGLTVHTLDVRGVEEFEEAFAIMARERPDALIMIADRFLLMHRTRIVALIAQHRLPTMYPYRDLVVEGD
jgi:putative tryptophan/tyrosine transport system substrate-binding protein